MGENLEKSKLLFSKNDVVRIELMDQADESYQLTLMNFFRRIGAIHLYWERILPTLSRDDAHAVAAIRDRPWPPWGGVSAHKLDAMCLIHPVGGNRVAFSPVFTSDYDVTNVGLIAAVYNEALESVQERHGDVDICYLVIEGSVLAQHVLRMNGFEKTEDLFLTEEARYDIYVANVGKLADSLGLADATTPDLLGRDLSHSILERNALFHGSIHLASRGGLLDKIKYPEIIPIDGGIFDSALPGGVYS